MKESERYCPQFRIIDMPSRQINDCFLQRANRQYVELIARLAVFQMLHDTSQGIDILSKKRICFDFSRVCFLPFVQALTDFATENVCLEIESALRVCVLVQPECVSKNCDRC